MDLNKKLSKAIEHSLDFTGISVRSPKYPQDIFHLDNKDDRLEIGIKGDKANHSVFLYTISEMLKAGEVELKFNFDVDKAEKHYNYLNKLSDDNFEY